MDRTKDLYFPVMGNDFDKSDYLLIDLSEGNSQLPKFDSVDHMTIYLRQLVKPNFKLAYGGYLEIRNLYQSDLFLENGPIRNIHLGVDIWGKELLPIYSPLEGRVKSVAYNGEILDYGFTLIIEYSNNEHGSFHLLFGHLSHHIESMWKEGDLVKKGQHIGYFGSPHENGGWSPHLHLQMIKDLQNKKGDYPGVCSKVDLDHFQQNCPNPEQFIFP